MHLGLTFAEEIAKLFGESLKLELRPIFRKEGGIQSTIERNNVLDDWKKTFFVKKDFFMKWVIRSQAAKDIFS